MSIVIAFMFFCGWSVSPCSAWFKLSQNQCVLFKQTLNLWVVHEVEKSSEEGVGRGISPCKVQIQNEHDELVFSKSGTIIFSLGNTR